MNKLIQRSFLNVCGTILYISFVGLFMRNAEKMLGPEDNLFSPIIFLTLFVLSAAITSSLILGKPILLFLNGEKTEAIRLFLYTIGWLAIALIILLIINLK